MSTTFSGDDAIVATHLKKTAMRGVVFGPLDLTIPRGSLTLVSGPDGSGKTSLLLTLVGRMIPDRGSELTVLGYGLPLRRWPVQRATSAVGFTGLDDLDESVTVGAAIRERKAWVAPAFDWVRAPKDAEVAELLGLYFDGQRIPKACTRIYQLDEAQQMLLRIAMAMMNQPQIVVVDQIDRLHDVGARDHVWRALYTLTQRGVTVVVSATSGLEADRLGWPDLRVVSLSH